MESMTVSLLVQSSFLRQIAKPVLAGFTQFLAEDCHLTGVRLDDIHHHPDGGSLAGAVRADQSEISHPDLPRKTGRQPPTLSAYDLTI